jgi:hypothetical protein
VKLCELVKQPIAGIPSTKPRPESGKLDRAEARGLDIAYRRHRNQALELRNARELMMAAQGRGELIEKKVAMMQAGYLLGQFSRAESCRNLPVWRGVWSKLALSMRRVD